MHTCMDAWMLVAEMKRRSSETGRAHALLTQICKVTTANPSYYENLGCKWFRRALYVVYLVFCAYLTISTFL